MDDIGNVVAAIVINGPAIRAAGARRLTFAVPRPRPAHHRLVHLPSPPDLHTSKASVVRYEPPRVRE